MTKRQAKKEALIVWKYLKEHPEIRRKDSLPYKIKEWLYKYNNLCPLCDYFKGFCSKCILGSCGIFSDYDMWRNAYSDEMRAKYTTSIYNRLQRWEVK